MREMGDRMKGGAVRDDRSPEKDAILFVIALHRAPVGDSEDEGSVSEMSWDDEERTRTI